jgi:hypothetical protein
VSKDGITRFKLIFEFDAVRARFGDQLFATLQVWDEIRGENILVTPTDDFDSDLTRPGEGFKKYKIKIIEDDGSY